MALNKTQKQEIMEDLKDKIAKQKAIILVGITGLKVKDMTLLRRKVKAIDGNLKVIKKTLAERVLREKKLIGDEDKSSSSTPFFDKNEFKEELAFVFGFGDELSSAKVAYQFSKENDKLKILGGFIENQMKTNEEVIILAQLPSRKELLAELVGSIQAPVANFVYALNYNIKGLITVLAKAKT